MSVGSFIDQKGRVFMSNCIRLVCVETKLTGAKTADEEAHRLAAPTCNKGQRKSHRQESVQGEPMEEFAEPMEEDTTEDEEDEADKASSGDDWEEAAGRHDYEDEWDARPVRVLEDRRRF